MKRQNAKDLLIDDHDYSTPADHYFSYLGKVKETGQKEQDIEVLDKLPLTLLLTD